MNKTDLEVADEFYKCYNDLPKNTTFDKGIDVCRSVNY